MLRGTPRRHGCVTPLTAADRSHRTGRGGRRSVGAGLDQCADRPTSADQRADGPKAPGKRQRKVGYGESSRRGQALDRVTWSRPLNDPVRACRPLTFGRRPTTARILIRQKGVAAFREGPTAQPGATLHRHRDLPARSSCIGCRPICSIRPVPSRGHPLSRCRTSSWHAAY